MITYSIYLALGFVLTVPLLILANKRSFVDSQQLLLASLVFAAIIYVGFALIWGNFFWITMEWLGILAFGLFGWLSVTKHPLWLAAGWLLHPLWDLLLHQFGPAKHIAPEWYVIACVSFDITVAGYIAYRYRQHTKQQVAETI